MVLPVVDKERKAKGWGYKASAQLAPGALLGGSRDAVVGDHDPSGLDLCGVQKEVEDKIQTALQLQMGLLLSVLRNHPAAFDDVVEGIRATARTSGAETECARRRGDGGRADRPPAAPLPRRQDENEARAQIGNDWMDLRTLRLSALRSVMVGWFSKALAETRDMSVREGKALQTYLRILDQESKYLGIGKSVRVTRRRRSKDKPSRVDVRDPIVRALTYQLKFVLGILQKHPAARDAVVEALRLSLSGSVPQVV